MKEFELIENNRVMNGYSTISTTTSTTFIVVDDSYKRFNNRNKSKGLIYKLEANLSIYKKIGAIHYLKKNLRLLNKHLSLSDKKDLSLSDKKDLSLSDKKDLSSIDKKDLSLSDKKDLSLSESKKDIQSIDKKDLSLSDKKDLLSSEFLSIYHTYTSCLINKHTNHLDIEVLVKLWKDLSEYGTFLSDIYQMNEDIYDFEPLMISYKWRKSLTTINIVNSNININSNIANGNIANGNIVNGNIVNSNCEGLSLFFESKKTLDLFLKQKYYVKNQRFNTKLILRCQDIDILFRRLDSFFNIKRGLKTEELIRTEATKEVGNSSSTDDSLTSSKDILTSPSKDISKSPSKDISKSPSKGLTTTSKSLLNSHMFDINVLVEIISLIYDDCNAFKRFLTDNFLPCKFIEEIIKVSGNLYDFLIDNIKNREVPVDKIYINNLLESMMKDTIFEEYISYFDILIKQYEKSNLADKYPSSTSSSSSTHTSSTHPYPSGDKDMVISQLKEKLFGINHLERKMFFMPKFYDLAYDYLYFPTKESFLSGKIDELNISKN